jgi:hypothetical protein
MICIKVYLKWIAVHVNSVAKTIFRSTTRWRACGHEALARTPSQGTTHDTDDFAGSLGMSCVLADRKVLQKTPVLANCAIANVSQGTAKVHQSCVITLKS